MRRFLALPVPDDARGALSRAVEPLRDRYGSSLRWARPESWHVTLAFLGDVAEETVPPVVEVVRGALGDAADGADGDGGREGSVLPRRLRFSEPGRFGKGVLWAGVDDEPRGSVATLGAQLQAELVAAGLPVQQQEVRPHVTLARGRRRSVTEQMVASVQLPTVDWQVRSVELWRSHLGEGPARYEVDASLPVS